MNLSFSSAKDNNQTFSVDKHFIHSPYSPLKEAERFVSLLPSDAEYDVIILIEPGFSYTKQFLKQKYPNTKIGIIRLIPELSNYNSDWDFAINFENVDKLQNQLLSLFTEEQLLCSMLCDWLPSKNLFNTENLQIWQAYKLVMEQCKTILITRQYFEKKWIINSCNYIKYLSEKALLDPQNILHTGKPVLIAASGPSLNAVISKIPLFREKCFIICLSSAIKAFLSNNIIPDLILTTDGGYYAGQHLKALINTNNLLVAAPCEAFIQKQLLEKMNIIPCAYSDGVSNKLMEQSGIKPLILERNGTVSGTALNLALSITNNEIYFLGLDLAGNKASQHTEPNELELNNTIKDFRLNNKESRQTRSRYNSGSLEIYRDWFKNQKNLNNRVFRVIENQEELGEIKNISFNDFEKKLLLEKSVSEEKIINNANFDTVNSNKTFNINNLITFINEYNQSDEWKKQIFPVDFISIKHAKTKEEKELLLQKLSEKNDKLIKKIGKILNGKTR